MNFIKPLKSLVHGLAGLTLVVFLQACASSGVPPTSTLTAEVVSDPPGLEMTLNGKVLGRAPLEIPLASFDDAAGFSTTRDSPPIVERRITVLSPDRVRVSIRLGDTPSPLAQRLGLARVVIFGYGEHTTFDTDSYELTASFKPLLDRQATTLESSFNGIDIYLCGHTDSTGGEESNRLLSVQRAQAVTDYLVSKGLDASRIKVQGFGSDYPIADNGSAAGRALNRRTEIVLPD